MKPIKVVCGLIMHDQHIFIARRKEGKFMASYWEFPGGKVEEGEQEETALQRELLEEFGMQVTMLDRVGEHEHHYDTFSIHLIAYRCTFISATFILTDHDAYKWVKPAQLNFYQWAPADLPFVQQAQLIT